MRDVDSRAALVRQSYGGFRKQVQFRQDKSGGASRDRTDDLIVANDALSQLSYSPTRWYFDFSSDGARAGSAFPRRYRPGQRSWVGRMAILRGKPGGSPRLKVGAHGVSRVSKATPMRTALSRWPTHARV